MTETKTIECSFCHKTQTQVKKLIASDGVYICNECVELCYEIIKQDAIIEVSDDKSSITSPREIKEFLDKYVIGQEYAKMVISVAVYNHYKRLNNPIINDVEIEKSNILLVGPSGVGKCVTGDTLIKVKINNSDIKEISFKELFQIISDTETHLFEYGKEYYQQTKIKILNENNEWCNVSALIKKRANTCQIDWSDNSYTRCAKEHLIRTKDLECKLAKDFKPFDEIIRSDGITIFCLSNKSILETDVYDLQIDSPNHLYQTSNGIVHHNTCIARTIAKMLDVPFFIGDATSLTEAGYVGDDVETIMTGLLQNADYDVEKAQRGIIYIDEIDKKGTKSGSASVTRDVSGEGVQQALLKIVEGTVVRVPPQSGRKHPQQEMIEIDTSNILFIVGGAFVGLEKIVQKRLDKEYSGIGFGSNIKTKSKDDKPNNILEKVEPDDFIKFGLIPEFVGRFPVHAPLFDLTKEELILILTEPKNAIVKQFKNMFKLDHIELDITQDALEEIASISKDRKTGARGLRSVIESSLMRLQYELPDLSKKGIKKVRVNKDVITGLGKPETFSNNEKKEVNGE